MEGSGQVWQVRFNLSTKLRPGSAKAHETSSVSPVVRAWSSNREI